MQASRKRQVRRGGGRNEVAELLLNNLVSQQPVLLPRLQAPSVKLGLPSPGAWNHGDVTAAIIFATAAWGATARRHTATQAQNLQQAKAGAESAIRGVFGEVGWSGAIDVNTPRVGGILRPI